MCIIRARGLDHLKIDLVALCIEKKDARQSPRPLPYPTPSLPSLDISECRIASDRFLYSQGHKKEAMHFRETRHGWILPFHQKRELRQRRTNTRAKAKLTRSNSRAWYVDPAHAQLASDKKKEKKKTKQNSTGLAPEAGHFLAERPSPPFLSAQSLALLLVTSQYSTNIP